MTKPNIEAHKGSRGRTRSSICGCLTVSAMALVSACGGGRSRPAAPAPSPSPAAGPASADTLCESGEQLLRNREFAAAAETLDRCIASNPRRAYAYYYAGLAYREIERVDLMTDRFETFVKLAPDAPERPQVERILNTLR